MHWNELLCLPCWIPLHKLSANARQIDEWLFEIGPNQFVLALPADSEFRCGRRDAPFVTIAYWAGSVAAAKRCALNSPSIHVEVNAIPPTELLLGTTGTYGALTREIGARHIPKMEHASYDGTTGEFVQKIISTRPFSYCFLDSSMNESELPYAIEVALL
ncbi:MAG: hypothetical protein JSS02_04465 [Planctomycetes bacterium]|nr:hypothetical protein [Planctomycetota bacterium]